MKKNTDGLRSTRETTKQ